MASRVLEPYSSSVSATSEDMSPRLAAARRCDFRALVRDRDTDGSSRFVGPAVDDDAGVGAGLLAVGNFYREHEAKWVGTGGEFRAERMLWVAVDEMPDKGDEARRRRAKIERHVFGLRSFHDDMRGHAGGFGIGRRKTAERRGVAGLCASRHRAAAP